MVTKVKGTKKMPGVEEIFVPGERGNKQTAEAIASEEIEIEDNLYAALQKVVGI
jgi:LDH2 family malate/lactate/ureidoglycolate dehydrogenase